MKGRQKRFFMFNLNVSPRADLHTCAYIIIILCAPALQYELN